MSDDRRSRSRSRSRSPDRGGDDAAAAEDNNNAPAPGGDNGGGDVNKPENGDGEGGGGEGGEDVKLYVGNLPFSATEDGVRDLFAQHGQVHSVSLIVDRDTAMHRTHTCFDAPCRN